MVNEAISKLVTYALRKGLIEPCEERWAVNEILDALKLDGYEDPGKEWGEIVLPEVLDELLDDALRRGVLTDGSVTGRDLLDTEIMGRLTPRPGQVIGKFSELYAQSPEAATDWYSEFSQDTNYIRRDRIAKDMRWKAETEYGELDITINLSKPEKDPRAVWAAKNAPQVGYPKCQLCAENEGYAGRIDHPARQNHRMIPITINGSSWFFQYSPYVYYNSLHLPQQRACPDEDRPCLLRQTAGFRPAVPALLRGIQRGPAHRGRFHFGARSFPGRTVHLRHGKGTGGDAGGVPRIVKWPLSVIRLDGPDRTRVAELAEKILNAWRGWSDPSVTVFAETDGEPHNTITPIARRRGDLYELDLVLRNNLTTPEHPLGLYHPHAELHHIKRENIGLIEVMGLAVLPSRLKAELTAVAECLVNGGDLRADELTAKHADWAEGFRDKYEITAENAMEIVKRETGLVFAEVLEHAGVFKRNEQGREAFLRFTGSVM